MAVRKTGCNAVKRRKRYMIPFPKISFYGIVLIGAVIILILSAPENGRIQNKEIISFIAGVFIVIGLSIYI
ncbi:MAG: hypothetical protein IKG34_07975 [Solobacterium sp.]|nr:hypothetical protein [Solobacterium sp.]